MRKEYRSFRIPFLLFLALSASFISCSPRQLKEPTLSSSNIPAEETGVLTRGQLFGLEEIPGLLSDPTTGKTALPEVMRAYWQLREKARQAGWRLFISSGYRSFQGQMGIWNKYFGTLSIKKHPAEKDRVLAAMRYKSIPGFSRHHWGTELDISERSLRGQLLSPEENSPQKVLDFYQWMDENAPTFGFCRIYRGAGGTISDERWHWSYSRLAERYERQMDGMSDLSEIEDSRVKGMSFIRLNSHDLYRQQEDSVDHQCQTGPHGSNGP